MKNGTMFADLLYYKNEDFYAKHPVIEFDTLAERQQYDILAVFFDEIYQKNEDEYKAYNFTSAQDAGEFDQFVSYIKSKALYKTGVTAQFGDRLITLITCSYHTDNGQLIVVARKQAC